MSFLHEKKGQRHCELNLHEDKLPTSIFPLKMDGPEGCKMQFFPFKTVLLTIPIKNYRHQK